MFVFPLLFSFSSFFITLLFGKVLGVYFSCILTCLFIFICFVASCLIFFFIAFKHTIVSVSLFPWVDLDLLNVKWEFLVDPLTASMLLVVTSISFLAHLYSIEYMHGDPHQVRFMSYLSLFTFFMLVLVYANNYMLLFVGWEGVGICSYLLINFWYTRISANKSSMMALITNKLGDISLMIGFSILFLVFKTLNYSSIFAVLSFYTDISVYLQIVCCLFILGAVGKSAQVGLHIWLPEAMEGPTPVSSLIHAATMVTAGIFLIIRSSFIFETLNASIFLWIVFIGSVTCFFSATIGIFQNDLKKVVAYSTCSQLGYMFLSCGLSGYSNSMYHLFNHAFFKALLFLTAGYIIHTISNEQDMRKFGGLVKLMPFSYLMILIGSLSLMGFPFFSGYYSKEKILELFTSKLSANTNMYVYYYENIYMFCYLISYVAIIFTMIYSTKLLLLTFMGAYNGYISRISKFITMRNINNSDKLYGISYSSYFLILPLFLLSILSILSGYFFSDLMLGVGTDFWGDSLILLPHSNWYVLYGIFLDTTNTLFNFEFYIYLRSITIFWTAYFVLFFFYIYSFCRNFIVRLYFGSHLSFIITRMLTEKYIYFNRLVIEPILIYPLSFSYTITYKLIDKGVLELIGPFGLFKFFFNKVTLLLNLQTKYLHHYFNYFFIGILMLVHFIFFFFL